jgi:hypothetical protein
LPFKNARCVNSPGSAARAPCPQEQIQDASCDEDASVAGDLHDVFPGIAGWAPEDGEQYVVQFELRIVYAAEMRGAWLLLGHRMHSAVDLVGDSYSIAPAQAQHRDGTLPEGRRDGGDRIRLHSPDIG